MEELYKVHRPKAFKGVVGQDGVIKSLTALLDANKLPHALLFVGPSGCGKTTISRILKKKLGCGDTDFHEMNAADDTGIDNIRSIAQRMRSRPMDGNVCIWLIDECHMLTAAAQNAFLKILEDTPKHVYFILATTNPEKLLKTVTNRCTPYKLSTVPAKVMEGLLLTTCAKEEKEVGQEVIDTIVEYACGSPRAAMVLLNSVIHEANDEDRMKVLHKAALQKESFDLCRVLFKRGATWADVRVVLKDLSEEPEQLRWMVLGYARSILLSDKPGGYGQAAKVIELFSQNFYDSKNAGLALACYGCVT